MKTRTIIPILVLVLAAFIFVNSNLYADRGSIPFKENVKIFEPNQRAMIAWNGVEEILLLTTDLYASESTKVLEVILLPSEPVVTKGDIEVFKKATDLINKKLARGKRGFSLEKSTEPEEREPEEKEPAGEITFHEKIGAHDISVAHVLNSHGFIEWVDTYLKSAGVENPKIPEELKTVIAEYLEEDFGWFVFDVVQLEREPKTNDAIQYRFKTDFLYYPLKITRTLEGYTTIDLLILTREIEDGMRFTQATENDYDFTGIPINKIVFPHKLIWLTDKELRRLNEEIYDLFGHSIKITPWLRIWQITGKLSSFEKDLIVKYPYGRTELLHVLSNRQINGAKLLIEQGTNVNARDEMGNTALILAIELGYPEVIKLLIEAGADVNAQDNNGYTALMHVSWRVQTAIAKLLIKSGADVNIQGKDGYTALICSSRFGRLEVIKLLIEAGADVNAKDNKGWTALKWASREGHTDIVKLLKETGAKE